MKEILYRSTRGNQKTVRASEAILKGLAEDGGLFVPVEIPKWDIPVEKLCDLNYQETAYEVMKLFLGDFTEQELKSCIDKAYDDKFDTKEIVPLVKADQTYYLELFHGATIAFKDMALSILPYLMTTAAKKNHISNHIVILTATSGDTGKAALEGFADIEGTSILVFYPKDGVSKIQEKQMLTQKGSNTYVVGIKGNFDDAQNGVKAIFSDKELAGQLQEKKIQFSSANSINIGRLIPQIVYYFYAYGRLTGSGELECGEKINVVVPTGNFGNILAAYYAKRMGLPIGRLICASNENKVLFDFFQTGIYNKNRTFILTSSPSMDILISSNLERLIYEITECDSDKTKQFMESLRENGQYEVTPKMKEHLSDFFAGYATEEQTKTRIKELFERTEYLIDPHTAVASSVYEQYKEQTGDTSKTIIVSTASPYKFTRSVMDAMNRSYASMTDFELVDELSHLSGTRIPDAIEKIRNAPILHHTICDKSEMKSTMLHLLNIEK